jgi:hypothetical protein
MRFRAIKVVEESTREPNSFIRDYSEMKVVIPRRVW